jgi:surface antigen
LNIYGLLRAFAALLIACASLSTVPAEARALQCAPFAREVSGINIHGNAGTWWAQADGVYDRGHEPRVGAVMVLASSRAMPVGHVAMVSKVVSEREVLLTHANWSYRGGIERDVRAIDVSEAGDWSEVRVWYAPIGDLGLRANPVSGFIYPEQASQDAPATDELAPPTVLAFADN